MDVRLPVIAIAAIIGAVSVAAALYRFPDAKPPAESLVVGQNDSSSTESANGRPNDPANGPKTGTSLKERVESLTQQVDALTPPQLPTSQSQHQDLESRMAAADAMIADLGLVAGSKAPQPSPQQQLRIDRLREQLDRLRDNQRQTNNN